MGTVSNFEDLEVWKASRVLVNEIYIYFGSSNNYGFKDQITRASLSIMNNIAEGFDRKYDKEFARFLSIASGSCAEVRSMLYVAADQKMIASELVEELQDKCLQISKMISSLRKYLKQS
jgi:four helix bundle protein